MEDNESRGEMDLSRASKNEPQGVKNDHLKSQKTLTNVPDSRRDNAITHLNNMISKERGRVRELKNLYMKEMGNKSDLEKIVRGLVEDVRESIVELERDKSNPRKRAEMSGEAR